MPELPEVENLARGLRQRVVGKELVETRCRQPKMLNLPLAEFDARARGEVLGIERRGKSCLLRLPEGSIWLHLGLGGLVTAGEPPAHDPQLALVFADASQLTVSKTFMGHAHYYDGAELARRWDEFGPDPTADDFTPERLRSILAGKPKQALKALLMDQERLAGIGNIYSNEILFAARLHPNRQAGNLAPTEVDRLYYTVGKVLAEAIRTGGEADHLDLEGNAGRYEMCVHGAQVCPSCDGPVSKATLAGRTAYFCPTCQT